MTLKEHHIYGSSRLGYQERNTLVHSYDYKAFYTENSYIAFGDTMGYIASVNSIYTLLVVERNTKLQII